MRKLILNVGVTAALVGAIAALVQQAIEAPEVRWQASAR